MSESEPFSKKNLQMSQVELNSLREIVENYEDVPREYAHTARLAGWTFEPVEYTKRLKALHEVMEEKGIDIALLSSPESQCWLHGYQARWYRMSSTTDWPPCNFTVVNRKESNVILIDSSDHRLLIRSTSNVMEEDVYYFDMDEKIQVDTNLDGITTYVVKKLIEKKWLTKDSKLVGIEEWSPRQNAATTYELKKKIADLCMELQVDGLEQEQKKVDFWDMSVLVRDIQKIKSIDEILFIELASDILDEGYERIKSNSLRWTDRKLLAVPANQGRPLLEGNKATWKVEASVNGVQTTVDMSEVLDGEAIKIESKNGAFFAVKSMVTPLDPRMTEIQVWAEMEWAMAQSGGETAGLHNTVSRTRNYCHSLSSTRPIGVGPLLLDPSGVKHRYHANTARMFYLGGIPPKEFMKASLIAAGASDILKGFNTEGKSFADLNVALLEYYNSFGDGVWKFRDWIGGYQLGVSFPPDWVGEFNWNVETAEGSSSEKDKKFGDGLVTNFESFIGGAGFIDTIVFRANRIQVLSAVPQALYVVDLHRHITLDDVDGYDELIHAWNTQRSVS